MNARPPGPTDPRSEVSEDELHAHVDGRLDPARRLSVSRHLNTHPDDAGRVLAYQRQREILRAAFLSQTARAPAPGLHLLGIVQRLRRRQAGRRMAVLLVVGLVVAGAAAWFLVPSPSSDPARKAEALLQHVALATYALYAPDPKHPTEVPAGERDHLQQWLSNRLNRAVVPPDLADLGYRLLGGRVVAADDGSPAALFMYEDQAGRRLLVMAMPTAPNLRAAQFKISQDAANGRAWIDRGLGYAIVAALPDVQLDRIADRIKIETKTSPARRQ